MADKFYTKLFGKVIEPYLDYFENLKIQMKRARMDYKIKDFLSLLIFFSFISFSIVMIVASFFLTIITQYGLYAYTFSIIIAILAAVGTFFAGYYYPNMKGAGIRKKIERELPFTTIHMATTASSGIPPVEVFKIISLKKGEIGKECERIYRNVRMLGMDLPSSIAKAANASASARFAELLWGMLSIITRGGDMEEYLNSKAKEFMGMYRRILEDYSNQVTFYTEIYITLIIVGTLFFIILTSIMSPMGGGSILLIQTFLIFFFTPMVSVGFLVLLKNLSPVEA
ncbi:MAG: type II secretion system F family protein [Candidatus Aenigmarchaeota archaeon]|nr:type II secretion system F family protein [Candidatus Aenigmarchaeota archaeon]